jgi:single-strand selective monofunctional uracil DNA glycosylase
MPASRTEGLIAIASRLRTEVARLRFAPPVSHVYNPLHYAWEPHCRYLARYGGGHPKVVLLGMNPGPFGMAQTGVPFGDVEMVRDWMGIEGRVERPQTEHPRRPVEGFACQRGEISGRRLWGWARERFGTAERFFARFFVLNYCPLCFLEESSRNRTPDKLPLSERRALFRPCDDALLASVELLAPRLVVGIGQFAAARAREALANASVEVGMAPHPSPASPAANRGWAPLMEAALAELGVRLS